jgi:hypothetical protein
MTSQWKYFGRSGPDGVIYELYRLPYTDKKIRLDDIHKMERIHSDGKWVNDPKDRGLYDEMLSGWFDYQDEISEEEANRLIDEWKEIGWPGRP